MLIFKPYRITERFEGAQRERLHNLWITEGKMYMISIKGDDTYMSTCVYNEKIHRLGFEIPAWAGFLTKFIPVDDPSILDVEVL